MNNFDEFVSLWISETSDIKIDGKRDLKGLSYFKSFRLSVILPLNCAYLYDSIKSNLIIDSILSFIASRYSLEILIFLFGKSFSNLFLDNIYCSNVNILKS